jgi:ribosomal-protein-alanine N-acetyltransferase
MSPAGVQLRRASVADLTGIVALERSIDTAPHWPPASYAAIVESQREPQADSQFSVQTHTGTPPDTPKRCLLVAETLADGEIVGFAVGLVHPGHETAELESVAVAASARRAGIGRALCAAVLGWSREQGAASVTLEVRAGSAAAVALYTGLGFAPAGHRPRYYRDPEDDALILLLPLAPLESEHKWHKSHRQSQRKRIS